MLRAALLGVRGFKWTTKTSQNIYTHTHTHTHTHTMCFTFLFFFLKSSWNKFEFDSAHILNLIVQSRLKSIHESFAKVQNAVRNVRASLARFEKFQECVDNEKIKAKCLLSLDVPTWWNSTYLMLDCALKYVRAFDRLEEEDKHYELYFCEANGNEKKPISPMVL